MAITDIRSARGNRTEVLLLIKQTMTKSLDQSIRTLRANGFAHNFEGKPWSHGSIKQWRVCIEHGVRMPPELMEDASDSAKAAVEIHKNKLIAAARAANLPPEKFVSVICDIQDGVITRARETVAVIEDNRFNAISRNFFSGNNDVQLPLTEAEADVLLELVPELRKWRGWKC